MSGLPNGRPAPSVLGALGIPAAPDAQGSGPQGFGPQGSGRFKIWEIRTSCHCLICGTCLSVPELRKIAAKANLRIPSEATDYEIHGYFVEQAGKPNPLAKLTQKALDRKYRAAIERCRACTSAEDLRAYWDQAMRKGEVPGPFWAVMTHPLTSDALATHVFGQVHMLSHLEGASNRSFRRKVHALEREKDTLAKTLSPQVAASRQRLAERDREIEGLRQELLEAEALASRLDEAEAELERYRSGDAQRSMAARLEDLESALAQQSKAAATAEAQLSERSEALKSLQAEADSLGRSLELIEAECESLAALVESGAAAAPGTAPADCPLTACPFDLGGRSIVYVGGRTGLVAHFRSLVEKANGRFIHHDGGIEENERRLGRLLSQGDVVLCPIDCVSHRACTRAKRFCKQTARTFVPLRSSGLSSFVSGLQQIAAQSADPGPATSEAAE